MDKELKTLQEVCTQLRATKSTIYKWMNDGLINCVKIGGKEELALLIEQAVNKAIKKIEEGKEDTQYLSREETATLCFVTPQTLNNWANSGKLKSYKINGRVLYKKEDIDKTLQERKVIKHRN